MQSQLGNLSCRCCGCWDYTDSLYSIGPGISLYEYIFSAVTAHVTRENKHGNYLARKKVEIETARRKLHVIYFIGQVEGILFEKTLLDSYHRSRVIEWAMDQHQVLDNTLLCTGCGEVRINYRWSEWALNFYCWLWRRTRLLDCSPYFIVIIYYLQIYLLSNELSKCGG